MTLTSTIDDRQSAATCGVGTYFSHLRWDIVRRVPKECRRILSVGCGAGLTEGELVKRGAHVLAVEMNPEAACQARRQGVEVLEGDVAKLDSEFGSRQF